MRCEMSAFDPMQTLALHMRLRHGSRCWFNFPWHSSLFRRLLDVVADDYMRDRGGNYLSGG